VLPGAGGDPSDPARPPPSGLNAVILPHFDDGLHLEEHSDHVLIEAWTREGYSEPAPRFAVAVLRGRAPWPVV
jgi:hypothetical protein